MNKTFQRFKILMMFLFLFCSSLFVLSPVGKSDSFDDIYTCYPLVELEYNKTLLKDPVIPYDEPKNIPITVKAKIYGPKVDLVLGNLDSVSLFVFVSVVDTPEGCFAAVNPPLLEMPVSDEFQFTDLNLSFTIDKDFPAFSLKKINVNFSIKNIKTLVKGKTFTKEIPFIVGYLPQLSFSYPVTNVKDIGPDETAVFPIEIENWGNSVTNVFTEVVDIPEGWDANIPSNLTLETNLFGDEAKEIITLKIKPPIGFGYREDREIIKLKMTPIAYNNSEYKGEPLYLYFIVQSKGFSTPGFEMVIMVFAFIIVFFSIWKKNSYKVYKKKLGRKKK